MKRQQRLIPKARAVIRETIENESIFDTEQAMAVVRPHFIFDAKAAREREIRQVTRQIIASIRDTSNVRKCYADEKGSYVNVEKATDSEALSNVRNQLYKKVNGINAGIVKVDARFAELNVTDIDEKVQ